MAALFLFDGIPYLLLVLWRRGPAGRAAALGYQARRARNAWLGTLASLGSYAIALWAMTRAPVAVVAALRETSVLFAVLIGTLWLREPFGAHRAVVGKLHAAIAEALTTPEVKAALEAAGQLPGSLSPAQTQDFVVQSLSKFNALAHRNKIGLQ